MTKFLTITLILMGLCFSACKKPPGSGGQASVKGRVIETNYDATFTLLKGTGPASDADVYIIYGSDDTYGDKTKTGPDGVFEFKYLRKGSYKIYVYSKIPQDPKPFPSQEAIYKDASISKRKEVVDVGDIHIIG